MNFQRGHSRDEPEINLIALIDVLLVILIFLMVTTSYAKFSELQINLPQAGGETSTTQDKPINITVDASEHYAVNGKATGFAGVEALAASLKEAAGGQKPKARRRPSGRGRRPCEGPRDKSLYRRKSDEGDNQDFLFFTG